MKIYWDSSALIAALQSESIRSALEVSESVTRSHALSEVFSTMTGGRLGFRCDADDVSAMIRQLRASLEIVDLTTEQLLDFIDQAQARGVRGGAVYDYLHAATAVKFGCASVFTLNFSDFSGLFDGLEIVEP